MIFLKSKIIKLFGKFHRSTSGATAVEFAILAPLFFMVMGGILGHSFVNLKQSHLDYTAYEAGSQVRIEDIEAENIDDFRDEVVCPVASVLLSCDDIEIGVQSDVSFRKLSQWRVADFYNDFCPGAARDIVVVTMRYKIQGVFKSLYFGFTELGDGQDYFLSSRYIVAREPTIAKDRLCS